MLCILIVNWNVREKLRACLTSLAAHPCTLRPQEIIVVDNASTDGSVEMLCAEFPDVHLIANASNRGFTGGNNDGFKHVERLWRTQIGARSGQRPAGNSAAPAEHYVLLLNPDTEVTRGALDELLAYAETHPDVGVVGPQLRYPDGAIQSTRRRFPTLDLALVESTWKQARAPRALLDAYYMRDLPDDATAPVDWLVGAALLARQRAVEQVGLLDEASFFMYSEEIDWCKRMRDAGYSVVYHPRAVIVHHEGASSGQVSARRMVLFNTSKVRYFAKHHGAAQAEMLRKSLLGQFRRQLWLERAKLALGSRPEMRRERIAAYRDVLASGLR
jgi:hypothetical protein